MKAIYLNKRQRRKYVRGLNRSMAELRKFPEIGGGWAHRLHRYKEQCGTSSRRFRPPNFGP